MSLPHALLGLLAQQRASGYELTKYFELSLNNVWPAKHSQIYPALAKLDTNGFVEVVAQGPRGRKEYAITAAGREELKRWLTDGQLEYARRHEDLLRVFSLWVLGEDQATAHFEAELEHALAEGRRYSELYHLVDWDDDEPDLYAAIVLEQGRRWAQMQVEWTSWALEQIRAHRTASTLTGRLDDSVFDRAEAPPKEG